jgi:hypothetical protein
LWKTHPALKRLLWTAHVPPSAGGWLGVAETPFGPDEPPAGPPAAGFVDLNEPIGRGDKTYIPLVRRSLDLVCHLDILFLRQEDPGALVLQGGDLDNRIKTLFDALRIPEAEIERRYPQAQKLTYCLLENDTLISGFDISSGRLLMPETTFPNEVYLVIEVVVRVLKLGAWNVCLMGD